MRLGSLFDGSGTAPLAAKMCGIDPVWASEIEPYPIKVTKARFPAMKHLGSITEINGAEVVPVDIICGGSPCQDLSVAGKQAGIHNGERSHLFFEMTRIIREMRGASNGKYPRYVVWENVPGAFSSNQGRDFLAVLQAFAEIADPDVHVPEPERRKGRLAWKYAGEMVGNGWSIAWRTVDAQYWGVPQRRRRIYLVADFGSERAGEILFEREGMSGHIEPCRAARKETAGDAQSGAGSDNREGKLYEPRAMKEENWAEQTAKNALRVGASKSSCVVVEEDRPVYCLQGSMLGRTDKNGPKGDGVKKSVSFTLDTIDRHAVAYPLGGIQYIVRRLTPLECCRLQGFPDWWEDGVEGSDSVRYKMWGNGMALPNMLHVMRGIAKQHEKELMR